MSCIIIKCLGSSQLLSSTDKVLELNDFYRGALNLYETDNIFSTSNPDMHDAIKVN